MVESGQRFYTDVGNAAKRRLSSSLRARAAGQARLYGDCARASGGTVRIVREDRAGVARIVRAEAITAGAGSRRDGGPLRGAGCSSRASAR